jgi:hypothetical protein
MLMGSRSLIMASYRLVCVDDRENLLGSRHVECPSDDQAIEMAKQETGTHSAIQVWHGEWPVCLIWLHNYRLERDRCL